MNDSMVYMLFPNFHPWGSYNRIVYRFRPYGNRHDMSIMECMILNPFTGERPQAAPLRMLGVDDDWTEAYELGLLTRVFNQDVYNLPKVQAGLESGALERDRAGPLPGDQDSLHPGRAGALDEPTLKTAESRLNERPEVPTYRSEGGVESNLMSPETPTLPRPRSDSLNDVRAVIPGSCYERSPGRAIWALLQAVALYVAPIVGLALTDRWWALLILWPLAGLGVAGLFVLGHDASHGALLDSRRLNRVIAQLCMAPSAHVEAAWDLGHNRIHHGYTTRQGFDFVWHPATLEEYQAMGLLAPAASPFRMVVHGLRGLLHAYRVVGEDVALQRPRQTP